MHTMINLIHLIMLKMIGHSLIYGQAKIPRKNDGYHARTRTLGDLEHSIAMGAKTSRWLTYWPTGPSLFH